MLKLILIAALVMHGIGHVLGPMASWTNLPTGFTTSPWLLGGSTAIAGPVGRIFSLVWVAALIAAVWAGVALFGGNPGWRSIALVAAVLSLAAMLPWWNTITAGARWGGTVFNLLLIGAITIPAGQKVIESLP